MATNKQIHDSNMLAIASVIVIIILSAVYILYMSAVSNSIERLTEENNRQWDYYRTLSGAIDGLATNESVDTNNEMLREGFRYELEQIEKKTIAKIYDLDITICKAEYYQDHISDIKKRTVRMKNIVGINPSVERTALVVETGLWYGSSVEIPTIMDDEEEYACGLEVISVK